MTPARLMGGILLITTLMCMCARRFREQKQDAICKIQSKVSMG